MQTIAFPAISCGVYGYPVNLAAGVALETVRDFLREEPSIERVYHVCFGAIVLEAYRTAFAHSP